MPTMKMGPVVNPNNGDKMKVQANTSLPPPPAAVPNPRNVGAGEPIYSGDLILAAQGASASVLNADHADATIVSLSGGPPGGHVTNDVNLTEVTSVDEYYDSGTGLTDTTLHLPDSDGIVIRG